MKPERPPLWTSDVPVIRRRIHRHRRPTHWVNWETVRFLSGLSACWVAWSLLASSWAWLPSSPVEQVGPLESPIRSATRSHSM